MDTFVYPKIILAEPENGIDSVYTKWFERTGCRVFVTVGQSTLGILGNFKADVDCVVFDVGYDAGIISLVDHIRHDEAYKRFATVPIILISNGGMRKHAEEALYHGADACFFTPVPFKPFVETIAEMIKSRHITH